MQHRSWAAALAALVLGTASLTAAAQPGHAHRQAHPPSHGHPGAAPHHGARPHAKPAPKGHPHGMPPGQAKKRWGAGPQHQWVKGSRLPHHYRSPQYVVNDWRGHGLRRPPKGHHWVQYGGDYLLVAVASGIIAQLILHP